MKKLQQAMIGQIDRWRWWTLVILLLSNPGLGQSLAPGESHRVAVVGPFSGPFAAHGERQQAAVRWAVEQLNEEGGVAGKPLELLAFDDRCDPAMAERRAREVLAAGVRLVVGHLCSAATLAAAPIYEAGDAVMITPGATDPALTRQGYRRVFRVLPTAEHQIPSAVGFLRERLQPQRLAVLHDDSDYGELVGRSAVNALQEAGVPVVLTARTGHSQNEFSRLVEVLAANRVDAIYYGGFAEELGLLLNQARRQGFEVPVMGADAAASLLLVDLAGAAAEGVYLSLPAALAAPPEAALQGFLEERQWTRSPLLVLASVAALRVLAAALELVGSQPDMALTSAIRDSVHATPLGLLSFDEVGEPTGFHYGIYRWQGDQVVPVTR